MKTAKTNEDADKVNWIASSNLEFSRNKWHRYNAFNSWFRSVAGQGGTRLMNYLNTG